jgi:hypothetical protein
MAVEPQGLMPSFGDHAAGLSLEKASEPMSRCVKWKPQNRRLEPMEKYTEAQRVLVWVEDDGMPRNEVLLPAEDSETSELTADDRWSSIDWIASVKYIVASYSLVRNMTDLMVAAMDKVAAKEAGRVVVPAAVGQDTDMHVPEECAGLQLLEATYNAEGCDGSV